MRFLVALAIALCAISFGASQNNQHQLFSNHDQEDPIIFDESNFSFYLGTAHSSWVFRVLYGQLQHFHWGPKTDPNDPLIYLNDECDIVSFDAGLKNSQMLEYPNEGSGDFRIPAFRLKYHDGYTVSNFTYSSHIIIRGPIENYHPSTPHARPRGNKDWTLIIRLEDKKYGIELELSYTIFYEFDTVARGVRLRNLSNQTIVLEEINSVASDFPSTTGSEQYHITHLAGAWARERQVITRPIQMGVSSFESRRGASSHQHNPFLILTKGVPNEKNGLAYAFGIMWPSSFRAAVEQSQTGMVRVVIGIHPDSFEWNLNPNTTFEAPESLHTFSSVGTGELSRKIHDLIRERISPADTKWNFDTARPILANSWEAMYFNCSEDAIWRKLVVPSLDLGIELIVLDDGWFKNRIDDKRALGDWVTDLEKFPRGISHLSDRIHSVGLKFGIWVEPEMISVESDLYKSHPDWILHVPGRETTESRNQLVLDLSRGKVQEFIVSSVSRIIKETKADYIKWDFNRHLTEVGNEVLDSNHQGELLFRWVLGLYNVFYRLKQSFPHVLIESCSGGGGRFDLAFHYMSHQIWTSDNTDALARTKIQYGTLFAYPSTSMASHVSTAPNHQLLRTTSFWSRHVVAMSGLLGYELDLTKLTISEKQIIKFMIPLYRDFIAPLIMTGKLYRIYSPFEQSNMPSLALWGFVSPDKDTAIFFCVLTSFLETVFRPPRIILEGLEEKSRYNVEKFVESPGGSVIVSNHSLTGRTLMSSGLVAKFTKDIDAILIKLSKI